MGKIKIKCYATLAGFQPENGDEFPIDPGETVGQVVARLGMDTEEVRVCFVNNRLAVLEHVLQDGDKVAFFPAVGGG